MPAQEPLFHEVVLGEALARARAAREFKRRVVPMALAIVGASHFTTLFKGSMERLSDAAFEFAEQHPDATFAELAEGLAKGLIRRIGGDDLDSEDALALLQEIQKCMSH